MGASPEAWSTMNLASWFGLRCGLLERVGMAGTLRHLVAPVKMHEIQTETLPKIQQAAAGDMLKLLCKELHVATNLAIDPALLDRAVEVSGERTEKAEVTEALEEFIARRQQRRVADLVGKLEPD